MTVCSCHVTYVFQSESTIYSCLNVKELLAWSRRKIWRWSDCNCTGTQNHLVLKQTLNHLAKLAKWLSYVLSTYLYDAFDCMLFSCHVRVPEWIHTLQLPECQGTPSSKQARNLKVNWLQLAELCSEYLSVRCIWLYVLLMSHTCFRVNPDSIVAWMPTIECRFESRCSHFTFRFRGCFEEGVP